MVNDGRFLYTVLPNDDGKLGGFALGSSYPNHLSATYYIYKMVIHTPSEHTYGGKKVPLELQLFHRKAHTHSAAPDGEPAASDTAIVALGFTESTDEASPFLKSLIDGGLPDQRGGTTLDNRGFPSILKFSELFKPVFGPVGQEAGFWDYMGSLTQPPCGGGVRWFVRQQTLNAKAKTLKYFSDVVKKSSGGVPGNARTLQIMGERPVYPRMARNAVHMRVFSPEEPDAFKEAHAAVKAHQKAFKEGLETDAGGADAALEAGANKDKTVLASNDYQDCVTDLGTIGQDLELAKTQQTNQCNEAKGFAETVDSIAGGPARFEGANKGAAASKSCDDQTKVVHAKEGQKTAKQEECETIKAKVEKKIEKTTLEEANKGASTN